MAMLVSYRVLYSMRANPMRVVKISPKKNATSDRQDEYTGNKKETDSTRPQVHSHIMLLPLILSLTAKNS